MPLLSRFDGVERAAAMVAGPLLSLLLLAPLLLLAACGQPGGYGYSEYGAENYRLHGEHGAWSPTHYYPPPGPPEDPWGPYIREAAARYQVPEQWVRAVMHQESDGQEQAVSPVGAMGLMQVMPATYEGLRERYGLGDDPFDPHNNVLAGTAYIREMYDRFGAPAFVAAYNAGPDRVDSYLAGTSQLPDETINYLAAVTPNLGSVVPLSGPLATYAYSGGSGRVVGAPSVASLAAGCNLNAAYDPNHPCTSLMQAAAAPAPVQQAFVTQTGANGCDLSAAYDPGHPCTSVGQIAAATAPAPSPQASVQQAMLQPAGAGGCDLSAAYDPGHPCTSAGQIPAVSPSPSSPAVIRQAQAGGCDVNVAYNPSRPCEPVRQAPRVQLASAEGCDPNEAFDPDRPCRGASAGGNDWSPPSAVQPIAATASARRQLISPSSAAADEGEPHMLAIPRHDWAIQVGAYANPGLARAMAEGARAEAPDQLRAAMLALPPTPYGGSVLYRARLVNLSASAAENACTNLNRRQLPCVVVQPSRS